MNKQDYYNTIGLQVESLFELVGVQTDNCFSPQKLAGIMPREAWAGIRRVIFTGCGDSYSAAGVVAPIAQRLAKLAHCASPDPMEFCRYYTREETLAGCAPEEVLVVAISASGSAARIVEILEKANAMGVRSMLVSNNPESKGAKAAAHMFCTETPPLCNSPGLRSYFANMIALTALSAFIGVCRGTLPEGEFLAIKQAVVDYTLAWRPVYNAIDDQLFALAKTWKDFERFDIIGDESELFSAQFVEEKFIECASVQCSHVDSEDWCHINFFLRQPQTVGTVFMVNSQMPDFDRVQNSVATAVQVGRPTLVVTDAAADAFCQGASVCTVPAAPAAYPWLMALMDFAPGSMLAAYCAAVAGKYFFGGRYDFRKQEWLPTEQPGAVDTTAGSSVSIHM